MYIGIDIGTTNTKVILTNVSQEVVYQVSRKIGIIHERPLYSEQDPKWWTDAVLDSLLEIKNNCPHAIKQLRSIGITGQMHGAICLDNKGNILRNAILWNDGRSYKECNYLLNTYPQFESVGMNKPMSGFTAPKIVWIKNNEPDLFKRIDKVLLPKDYVRYYLTGEYATDMSDASGTLWLDIKGRKWSEELLSACDLTLKNMPQLLEGSECSGYLKKDILNLLGITHNIKVIAGGSDNAAGALSMGICNEKDAMISLGTSGVYFTPCINPIAQTDRGLHTFCHAIKDRWHYMGVVLSAASALEWCAKLLNIKSVSSLIKLAESSKKTKVPIFLPYLSGERTPHDDPFAKASLIGMDNKTTNSEVAQAVLEGVSFSILDCQNVITNTGIDMDGISIIGGGSRSLYWGSILSNTLNRTLYYHNESSFGPAFGAVRLSIYEDTSKPLEEVFYQPTISNKVEPVGKESENLQKKAEIYSESYQKLKYIYKSIGA
jgi:xylulokinase